MRYTSPSRAGRDTTAPKNDEADAGKPTPAHRTWWTGEGIDPDAR
jgi:hypothetical protein